eukprot:GHVL01010624.1.p1 GENE.GHVL01010624.1~~GHVL01010624.1.p1  ORF type:complete len:246 (+),score=34.55 GHVL01010624.1:478-1215(+)
MLCDELFDILSPCSSAQEAIALLVHCRMLNASFRCVGLEEETSNIIAHDAGSVVQVILPNSWNYSCDSFSFLYRSPKSDKLIHLKAVSIADCFCINAAEEGSRVFSIDLKLCDHVMDFRKKKLIEIFKDVNSLNNTIDTEFVKCLMAVSNDKIPDKLKCSTLKAQPQQNLHKGIGSHDLRQRDFVNDQRYHPLHQPQCVPDGMIVGPNHPAFGRVRQFPTGPFGRDPDPDSDMPNFFDSSAQDYF